MTNNKKQNKIKTVNKKGDIMDIIAQALLLAKDEGYITKRTAKQSANLLKSIRFDLFKFYKYDWERHLETYPEPLKAKLYWKERSNGHDICR